MPVQIQNARATSNFFFGCDAATVSTRACSAWSSNTNLSIKVSHRKWHFVNFAIFSLFSRYFLFVHARCIECLCIVDDHDAVLACFVRLAFSWKSCTLGPLYMAYTWANEWIYQLFKWGNCWLISPFQSTIMLFFLCHIRGDVVRTLLAQAYAHPIILNLRGRSVGNANSCWHIVWRL